MGPQPHPRGPRRGRRLPARRNSLFGESFPEFLELGNVERVRLPARSPNLNAYAERFIGSNCRECLHKMIPLGQRHLERTVREYVRHCDAERSHQGLCNRFIGPSPCAANGDGPIECSSRLGGLLRYYHREAA